jgi:hypothetical protein
MWILFHRRIEEFVILKIGNYRMGFSHPTDVDYPAIEPIQGEVIITKLSR